MRLKATVRRELAELVLERIERFRMLEELHRLARQDRPDFMSRLYQAQTVCWRGQVPFLRPATTLSLLVVPAAFAASLRRRDLEQQRFRVRREHDLLFSKLGRPCRPSPGEVLGVFSSAMKGITEFARGRPPAAPNAAFDRGVLRCWTGERQAHGRRELVFRSEAGYGVFVMDLVRVCRGAASAILARK